MQLTVLLVILVGSLSGCGHKMPKSPQGQLLIHNQPKGIAVCSDIQNAQKCPPVAIENTHRYVMFSPQTWQAIQNYIDALIRKIKEQSHAEYEFMSDHDKPGADTFSRRGFYLSETHLKWFKGHLKTLEVNTLNQVVTP